MAASQAQGGCLRLGRETGKRISDEQEVVGVSAYPLSILRLTVPAELFGGVSQPFILDSRRPSEDLVYQPISSGGSWIGPHRE